jgi:SAM-dependent methyltransferase
MIETTVSEINITELMERVRAEALRPKPAPRRPAPRDEKPMTLPPVAKLPAAPAVWIPGPVKSRNERLEQLVETARKKNEPHSRVPKFLRRFFRKQGGYNRAVAESIAVLSKTADDLTRRTGEITACLGHLNSWLLAVHEQSDSDANWMNAAAPGVSLTTVLANNLTDLQSAVAARSDEIEVARSGLEARIQAAEARSLEEIASMRTMVDQLRHELAESRESNEVVAGQTRGLQTDLGQIGVHLRTLQAHVDALTSQVSDFRPSVAESLARHAQQADDMQHQVDHAGLHLRNLQAQTDLLQGQADRLGVHINNLQGFVDQQTAEANTVRDSADERIRGVVSDTVFLKGELSEFRSLLRSLLSEKVKPGSSPGKPSGTGAPAALDSFYFNFENRFRGSKKEIKARVAFYLPFIRKARAGSARRPILDLGCGRGEWLELLKEEKLVSRGVDLNTTMIAHCKAHRLKAQLGDAVEHLRSLRANSHGAITGFHIIEHLPFEILMDLFGEARRVLQPGGVAIFESPNCKNLVVGASNFNIDPTHRNPVFPETAEFMLASHGFEEIRIEYLSPVSDIKFNGSTPELAIIKDFLFGPQDFGIVAHKPKAR